MRVAWMRQEKLAWAARAEPPKKALPDWASRYVILSL